MTCELPPVLQLTYLTFDNKKLERAYASQVPCRLPPTAPERPQQGCAWLQIADKKLKGRLQHVERLAQEAAEAAARAEEWLLPAEAGGLEAEGMEQTWRFQQVGICPTSSGVGQGY